MAEKTIGIRINLNGLNGVVKDIQTLEKFINEAREDLKQLEIGSEQFNQLSAEISRATGQLQGLNRSAESLSPEKIAEGFGKLGAGISSSFAAATAAVSLFGNQSEDVTKAAAKAQNLLTLALSIRGVMEIKTGAQIVARTIVEKASAAATLATNTATKTLYATLAANPYGAIIAVVGLLVAAFVSLGEETKETTEKYKTLDEIRLESQKSIIAEVNRLKTLRDIINDGNASLDAKKGAYTQLQKLVPTLTNLTLEQAQAQGILNTSISDEIKLIELRAKQKALEDYFVQQEKKNLEANQKARADYIKSLNIELNQLRQRLYYDGQNATQVEESVERLKQLRLAQKGLSDERETYRQITEEITELENKQNKVIVETKGATQDVTKVEEERKKQAQEYIKLLLERIKLESDLLVQTVKLDKIETQIEENIKKNISTAQGYASQLDQLKTLTELYKEANMDLNPTMDDIGGAFGNGREILENYFNRLRDGKLETEDLKKATQDLDEKLKPVFNKLVQYGGTEKQKQEFKDYVQNYKLLVEYLNNIEKLDVNNLIKTDELEKAIIDVSLATQKITTDPYERAENEITAAKVSADERLKIIRDNFNKIFVAEKEKELRTKLVTETQRKEFDASIVETRKSLTESANLAFDSLVKNAQEILIFEEGVELTAKSVDNLNAQLMSLQGLARQGFLLQNAEELAKQFQTDVTGYKKNQEELTKIIDEGGFNRLAKQRKNRNEAEKIEKESADKLLMLQQQLVTKQFDKEKKFQEDVNKLTEDLKKQGINIDVLTYEQRLLLLEKFLQKEVEATKSAEDKKKDARSKTISDISKTLEQFNQLVGRLASVTSQYFEFQLQKLDDQNKKAQEQVVGDTEEANKKRLELESQYQKQKAEIEKRARVRALQFQLAQAIADGAQAVLAVIEIPPLALAVGALAAAQIAIIAQQLSYVQSLAGGGKIRMGAGGMVLGPSHEMGGVSFAGGVNLEGGESVINRQSSLNYGGLLSTINQQGGGRPIVNNASGSLMEERLLQALVKERNTPIRAYVLSSEITNSQAINKKLDELSTI